MNKECLGGVVCSSTAMVSTAMQTDLLLSRISIILTILCTLITILLGLRGWWKDAKQDGKITKDEVKDAIKIVCDGTEKIKEELKKGNKEDENKK